MRHATLMATFAVIVGCATAHAADVYRYVDEQGRTHYTDRPVLGAVLVTRSNAIPPAAAAQAAATNRNATNTQLAASNQRIAEGNTSARAAATVQKDLADSRAERCKKAREDYRQTIESRRLYREAADGKRTYLSDAELAQARVDSYKTVESVCGPQG